jgi:hypothetical protein
VDGALLGFLQYTIISPSKQTFPKIEEIVSREKSEQNCIWHVVILFYNKISACFYEISLQFSEISGGRKYTQNTTVTGVFAFTIQAEGIRRGLLNGLA